MKKILFYVVVTLVCAGYAIDQSLSYSTRSGSDLRQSISIASSDMPNPTVPPGGTGWTGWYPYEPGCVKFRYYFEGGQLVYVQQEPLEGCSGSGNGPGDDDEGPAIPGGQE